MQRVLAIYRRHGETLVHTHSEARPWLLRIQPAIPTQPANMHLFVLRSWAVGAQKSHALWFASLYHCCFISTSGTFCLQVNDYLPTVPAHCSHPGTVITRAPLGGGYFEPPPPLVFLRYLLNRCRYHRQTCRTLSPNIFTHCVKILKSRVS